MARIKLRLWFRKLSIKTSSSSASASASASRPPPPQTQSCSSPPSPDSPDSGCDHEMQDSISADNTTLPTPNYNSINDTAPPNPHSGCNTVPTPNGASIPGLSNPTDPNPCQPSNSNPKNSYTVSTETPNLLLDRRTSSSSSSAKRRINNGSVHCGCNHYSSSKFASSFRRRTQGLLSSSSSSCKGKSSEPSSAIEPVHILRRSTRPEQSKINKDGAPYGRIESRKRKKRLQEEAEKPAELKAPNDEIPKTVGNGDVVEQILVVKKSDEPDQRLSNGLKKDVVYANQRQEPLIRDQFSSFAATSEDTFFSSWDKSRQSFSSNSSCECTITTNNSEKSKQIQDHGSASIEHHLYHCHHSAMSSSTIDRSSKSFRDINVDNFATSHLNAARNSPLNTLSNTLVGIREDCELEDRIIVEDNSAASSRSHDGSDTSFYVDASRSRRQANNCVARKTRRKGRLELRRKSSIIGEKMLMNPNEANDQPCPQLRILDGREGVLVEEGSSAWIGSQTVYGDRAGAIRRKKRRKQRTRQIFDADGRVGVTDGIGGHAVDGCMFSPRAYHGRSYYSSIQKDGEPNYADQGAVEEDEDYSSRVIKETSSSSGDDSRSDGKEEVRDGQGSEIAGTCDGGGDRWRRRRCMAVVKRSEDPVADFHSSMLDVIVEEERSKGHAFSAVDMERLLRCFLSLNSAEHHHAIVTAFTRVWDEVYANSITKYEV